MNGWDFGILWSAGRAVLTGQDPYSVPFFYYPLPMAYILAGLGILPQAVAFWLWLAVNLGLLIYFFRRRFWQWLLYAPVLHMFSAGQVDMAFWALAQGLGRHYRGAALGALITLKPQMAIIFLPWHLLDWLRHDRRTLAMWAALTGLLWGLPFLWRPGWLVAWRAALPIYDLNSASNTPGLLSWARVIPAAWPLLAVLAVAVFLWGQWQSKDVARATAQLSSPIGLFYSTVALLDAAPAWLLVPLSWLAVLLTLWTKTFIPFSLLPLAALSWQLWRKPKDG